MDNYWKVLVKVTFPSPFVNLNGPISNIFKLSKIYFHPVKFQVDNISNVFKKILVTQICDYVLFLKIILINTLFVIAASNGQGRDTSSGSARSRQGWQNVAGIKIS